MLSGLRLKTHSNVSVARPHTLSNKGHAFSSETSVPFRVNLKKNAEWISSSSSFSHFSQRNFATENLRKNPFSAIQNRLKKNNEGFMTRKEVDKKLSPLLQGRPEKFKNYEEALNRFATDHLGPNDMGFGWRVVPYTRGDLEEESMRRKADKFWECLEIVITYKNQKKILHEKAVKFDWRKEALELANSGGSKHQYEILLNHISSLSEEQIQDLQSERRKIMIAREHKERAELAGENLFKKGDRFYSNDQDSWGHWNDPNIQNLGRGKIVVFMENTKQSEILKAQLRHESIGLLTRPIPPGTPIGVSGKEPLSVMLKGGPHYVPPGINVESVPIPEQQEVRTPYPPLTGTYPDSQELMDAKEEGEYQGLEEGEAEGEEGMELLNAEALSESAAEDPFFGQVEVEEEDKSLTEGLPKREIFAKDFVPLQPPSLRSRGPKVKPFPPKNSFEGEEGETIEELEELLAADPLNQELILRRDKKHFEELQKVAIDGEKYKFEDLELQPYSTLIEDPVTAASYDYFHRQIEDLGREGSVEEEKTPIFPETNSIQHYNDAFTEHEIVQESEWDVEQRGMLKYLSLKAIRDRNSATEIIEEMNKIKKDIVSQAAKEYAPLASMSEEDAKEFLENYVKNGSADYQPQAQSIDEDEEETKRSLTANYDFVPQENDKLHFWSRFFAVVEQQQHVWEQTFEISKAEDPNGIYQLRLEDFALDVAIAQARQPTPLALLNARNPQVEETYIKRYPFPGLPVSLEEGNRVAFFADEDEEYDISDEKLKQMIRNQNLEYLLVADKANLVAREGKTDDDYHSLNSQIDLDYYANQQLEDAFMPARQFAVIDFINNTVTFVTDRPDRTEDVIPVPLDWMNTFKQMMWPPTPESVDYQWLAHMIYASDHGEGQRSLELAQEVQAVMSVNPAFDGEYNEWNLPLELLPATLLTNTPVGKLNRLRYEIEKASRELDIPTRSAPREKPDGEIYKKYHRAGVEQLQREYTYFFYNEQRVLAKQMVEEGKIHLPNAFNLLNLLKKFKISDFTQNGLIFQYRALKLTLNSIMDLKRDLVPEGDGKIDVENFSEEEKDAFLRFVVEHPQILALRKEGFGGDLDQATDSDVDAAKQQYEKLQSDLRKQPNRQNHLLSFGIAPGTI